MFIALLVVVRFVRIAVVALEPHSNIFSSEIPGQEGAITMTKSSAATTSASGYDDLIAVKSSLNHN